MNEISGRRDPAPFNSLCPRSPARRLQRLFGVLIWAAGLMVWLSDSLVR
ncbi:hypothetical protein [Azoarcus olearius]|uniref:Hypothetical membrane protein n=1 Tax=Azoarcus sp. (strain BH72) TaxID=418699 RepID=A1K4T6_AZOSB|nr:hypothetical protein [Azoarcus olearius]ANQ84392.1 hypothetical protein dqs_1339 [Azoarcus olearius]CAL93841.1 hypothetical membrane protein [Azoarcus olearius]